MEAGPFEIDGSHTSKIRAKADAKKVGFLDNVIRALTSN